MKKYLECPACEHESLAYAWDFHVYFCEGCEDDHIKIKCPVCGEWIELVEEDIKEVYR